MREPRKKLPRSVVVLNIIMIVLILVICGLTFSLAMSAVNGESQSAPKTYYVPPEPTSEPPVIDITETIEPEVPDKSETTTKLTVSMTKVTTDPTEPIDIETEPAVSTGEAGPAVGGFDKAFFEDDLFIGDSISTGLYLYGKLDMKNVAASVGYTPYKAYTDAIELYDGSSATAVDYAGAMKPKRIFIMLGSNGMASSYDAEAMKGSYRTLIEKLNEASPDSEIYCLSVSPVTADSSSAEYSGINNDMIREFNSFLEDLCEELELRYFDLYSLLADENGFFRTDYAEVDGLHFLGTTYDVMLGYIQSELS